MKGFIDSFAVQMNRQFGAKVLVLSAVKDKEDDILVS
jgi:hypothetical protein